MTKEELHREVASFRSLLATVKPTSKDENNRNNLIACYEALDGIYHSLQKLGLSDYNFQWQGGDGHTGRSQIESKLQNKDLTMH